ncbi:hypothetical protein WI99_11605 [Burkholderia cepacia]|nr:hypothetical protein WI99_11605 [Burkholderia cepacia]
MAQVRSLMREKGLLSADLAERAGVSKECVSRWLKGASNIQIDSLYRLADALEEPLTILFGPHEQLVGQPSADQSATVEDDDVECEEDGITLLLPKYASNRDLNQLRVHFAANDDEIIIESQETYEPVFAHA